MARIRSIKPEFCSSADTGALSRDARLFFLQLLTEADDSGRMLWIPRRLCGLLYPHDDDVSTADIEKWAGECATRGMVTIYRNSGVMHLQVTNWAKHQRINRASESKLPSPSHADSVTTHGGLTEDSLNSHGGLSEDVHREQGTGNREGEQGRGTGSRESSLRSDSQSPDAGELPSADGEAVKVTQHPASERLFAAVLESYHRRLPKCQRISVLNPKRRKRIIAADKLARQVCREQGWPYDPPAFWEAYFAECEGDPWMRGEVPNPRNPAWKQNLDVLLAEDRFAGIMDRAIDAMRREAAA